ncbi:MAG TPA: hypothetical protein VJ836_07065 [Candidatus Saccharimonadales bacterium]|nr:hypothetical protein [Candidatus Saccharimonadales bacterium]
MKMPVTQFWDSRLLYIYALLSGYVQADQNKLQDLLNAFVKYPNNKEYCLAVIEKLQSDSKVESIDNAVETADTRWFKDMVSSYIEYFLTDRLFAPTGNSVTLYAQHEARLLNKLGTTSAARDIKGNQSSNSKKFLETLLTVASKGLITIESIKPTDETCQAFIAAVRRTDNAPLAQKLYAEAKIDGTQILIGIKGKELFTIKSLRIDSGPYNFMHYVQAHTNQNIGIGDIQLIAGCQSYKDLPEVVRQLGFSKELKDIFFDGTSKKTVRFTPVKELSSQQQKGYVELLKSYRK